MRKLYGLAAAVLLMVTAFWWSADSAVLISGSFFQVRAALIQLSGILSVTLMVMVMLLALRLPWVEKLTHGLDKSYRLHKWLGIGAVTTAIVHWLIIKVPKYLVSWGLLSKPVKNHIPPDPDSWFALVAPWHSEAKSVGELAFYLLLVLALISLSKIVKYKGFKWSHKLMAVCFLAIGFHSVVLIKRNYWQEPVALLVIGMCLVGVLAALWSLSNRIGRARRYPGIVREVTYHECNKVTHLVIDVPEWKGHQSGQFAYLRCQGHEAHPFTIASYDDGSHQLQFMIKALGDFTCGLNGRLSAGDEVRVEGPYGDFAFTDEGPALWIAGGVGIAAFKSILEERVNHPSSYPTIMYYCTACPDQSLIEELHHSARLANVTLRVLDSRSDARLTAERLQREVSGLLKRNVWFCGPAMFADSLRRGLQEQGFDARRFHYELFEMR
ncbi:MULTISPECIES: ferredoxin reductase family protein [unclassified Vibrio]|uniref:ferredoxin reductase family protein n=1 Tax=unclassified Vibrio TaxID=2614977 RepID=UPI00136190F1|nr:MULTISPECIES: ferric reductase-like transmembrane domain-containing protein [unclassified Vibrio]NAW57165.1 oxidoreductase [Vibrio sp. V36_P2S2PM302]NAX24540.1 oxidoreductase [Vibrio sp. V38_P2S17PM301]NAX31116.1 oxidoreductase [Vibrio sp. V37_P2S8PM304]